MVLDLWPIYKVVMGLDFLWLYIYIHQVWSKSVDDVDFAVWHQQKMDWDVAVL